MAGSILLGSGAQLAIKMGMNQVPPVLDLFIVFPWVTAVWVTGGLSAYALSMLMWMIALAKYELSFAYPMLSLSYILVYLGAVFLPELDETVSITKTIGILLIVGGVIFVTNSHSETDQK